MTEPDIFVAGSLHYDIVMDVPHLPGRDETVLGGTMRFVCGGKGGNQAVAAARHGARVAFGGAVGDDQFGRTLLENLTANNVDCRQVSIEPAVASGASVAVVDEAGDYGAVVASGANQLLTPAKLRIPDSAKYLLLQNEIPEPVNHELARRAKELDAKIVLNAAPWRPISRDFLNLLDILVVNRVEAEGMLGRTLAEIDDLISALSIESTGCSLIVTLGADGLVFREPGNVPSHMPSFQVEVISTHGAGDTFVGAMSARLSDGDGLEDTLTYASAAAALHVSAREKDRYTVGRSQTHAFMETARLRA